MSVKISTNIVIFSAFCSFSSVSNAEVPSSSVNSPSSGTQLWQNFSVGMNVEQIIAELKSIPDVRIVRKNYKKANGYSFEIFYKSRGVNISDAYFTIHPIMKSASKDAGLQSIILKSFSGGTLSSSDCFGPMREKYEKIREALTVKYGPEFTSGANEVKFLSEGMLVSLSIEKTEPVLERVDPWSSGPASQQLTSIYEAQFDYNVAVCRKAELENLIKNKNKNTIMPIFPSDIKPSVGNIRIKYENYEAYLDEYNKKQEEKKKIEEIEKELVKEKAKKSLSYL
jgi:hypothetical protein